ncbi:MULTISPECIES: polysaccharide deacetylase family protein [Cytobacillus]|uniref:polysaccharide deacetylase family protein n=1 Tax=Cytobacillus TaxID=2675230 RepID=UPI000380F58F|nr:MULTISPECIES: polysaccharide deacetylase family protein [Cytobacillus]MCM3245744.1 polysaccharide deacetylase family protein [Cytobacillus oceanisediminis]MCM3395127.1 polysaccharide deacetylase family protein [Cytobacillus oceanisediminis]MCM3527481.1 polysaccharide deacetylase family protein [Cytobacillus oceanisediminis]UQX55735.1 polysaccharide deacetylase family protein [Cytobacillus pseudoceanisediminis]USK46709.1 polysaccharide deacetylase family protein [Cytobacillus oceanisediminis
MDSSNVVYVSNDPDIKLFNEGHASKKTVVLTFDDGPGRVLPEILDILKKENVPAVFFWQSRLLYPQRPWKRVIEEGHQIGTHSSKHSNYVNLSPHEQVQDLSSSKTKIESIIGQEVKLFRPPFGQYNEHTIAAAKQLGLSTIMWRISAMDWELKEQPEQIIANVIENLEEGAIILLHELTQTVEALPALIAEIRNKGYEFSLL